jgi:hypothetical protein
MESAEKAGKLLEKLFSVAIEKVETIIDEELVQTHESISRDIESSFQSILRKLGYSQSSCSLISVQVQSGGVFDPSY